ncbi:clustered mitochondria protein-like isoform X2 [Phoenix dactylifera]|uniref:Clustered mitochondria protein homolog n=1 Tax=Phoenix dactylifera TaxID=42345 RepID=A0A8B8J8Q6_PHODC|nr:clustered mitochondria protein-like isoform X2 [Phoenix dactylifera]
MAGKSNKAKNKGRAVNSNPADSLESESKPLTSSSSNAGAGALIASNGDASGIQDTSSKSPAANVASGDKAEMANPSATTSKEAGGELHLYPVAVKAPAGEKLELQLSPGDSVMDVRQFLLDAPETCFFTCYDLILHTKDGSVHHLEDYNEMSEVADITTGGCTLEMVAALYDERSIRSHVRRARELLSLSTLHLSLSTLLASHHETAQQKTSDVKTETPDGLGFMEDITGSLHNLVTPTPNEIKCVESIVFSSFNPPPTYRRLVGDLIYIDVVTLEGNKFCITGTSKAFYVNFSTGNILDPRPSKPAYEASTLIGLLQKISSKFKKGFREILDRKASAHPFETVQSLLPPNSWLGHYPIPGHERDAARAEDAFALSYGSELIGMQRDWNEELQSCREFPHNTSQERILRDRALYKVTCDFVDAAIKGAIGVINRCIPPINPTDPESFHMYVHNNIFFSFAVDADLGQISKDQALTVKSKSGHGTDNCNDVTSPNLLAKTSGNTFCGTYGDSRPCMSMSHNTEQFRNVSDHTSDTSAEAQISDNEQATYASANNDLKGTKAYQEADVPGLYNLAMVIIDYRGYRVVAQSIIPGILQGDKSDSLLYGSVDNGKKICWDESFHSKVVEAAKRLHLKEHAVMDGSGNVVKLAAPVESKGIIGSDDRHYLLDLMRVTPRDANYSGPGLRFCVLRPELVASFCEAEAAESSHSRPEIAGEVSETPDSRSSSSHVMGTPVEVQTKAGEECASAPAEAQTPGEDILLNPNVFTEFKLAGSQEDIAADEAIVRKAASYLTDVVLRKFVQDLCSLEVSPMDGQSLTDALHAHGINVRYLGKVADMVKHLPHLWDICSTEIVVRSAKHILKDMLRESQDHDVGPAIAHFFNCFAGNISPVGTKGYANNSQSKTLKKGQENHKTPDNSGKGQMRWRHGASSKKGHSAHLLLTSEGLWSNVREFAKFKYQFELPDDARIRVNKVAVIRNLCQKVGITIAARKFDLDSSAPFQTSDILDLQPVVKHSVPVCLEARNLMESGKARLAEGMLNEAYTQFSEAFSILQQITGPMHRDVANCCRYLAMVLYHAGDMAGAIVQQHKELIINERCLGLDHPDTAHSYGNMALFYHGLNQTELALRHMSRTLLLLSLSSGPDHPDVAATFINVAMMYQDIGNMNAALRYLQEALKKNERLLGPEHIQTAVCYHALAIAFNCMGAYKLSIQHEKKTYDILVKQLGEEDSRTQDSENWIKTFKLREQQANAQKQKGQVVNTASALKAIDVLKAFQAAAGGSGNASSSSVNKSLIGESLPRGRGVDERAARAAAEMRKKAAARGLLVRQNGVPVQALPPLTQLLNIINSGATASEAQPNAQANEPKREASNGSTLNGTSVATKDADGSVENRDDQGPVGLGTSLASLDSKKQKPKPKATA